MKDRSSDKAARKRYEKANREWMQAQKKEPCLDCRKSFPPVCMDFDHVRGRKLFPIGAGAARSRAQLRREIAKCEVVCANCHRLRTERRKKR